MGKALRVVLATVAAGTTAEDPRVREWRRAAKARQWRDIRVLGLGAPWRGFRTKTTLFLALCERLPADTLVAATDAYDLLACGSQDELVHKFCALPAGKSVIVSAESVRGPNTPVVAALQSLPAGIEKRYLNSGVIVGTAGVLRSLFAHSLQACPHDDQIGVGSFANAHPGLVHVDTRQRFALNLNFCSEVDAQCRWHAAEKRFSYRVQQSEKQQLPSVPVPLVSRIEYPVFIHTPFVGRDLGFRDRYVRGHLLLDDDDDNDGGSDDDGHGDDGHGDDGHGDADYGVTYQPRSRAAHCYMAFRHVWKLTKNDPVYRRLACSVSVAMVGAAAVAFSLQRMKEEAEEEEEDAWFWRWCGAVAMAFTLFGKGWCLWIVNPRNVRYLIEVFLLLTGLEVVSGACTAFVLRTVF